VRRQGRGIALISLLRLSFGACVSLRTDLRSSDSAECAVSSGCDYFTRPSPHLNMKTHPPYLDTSDMEPTIAPKDSAELLARPNIQAHFHPLHGYPTTDSQRVLGRAQFTCSKRRKSLPTGRASGPLGPWPDLAHKVTELNTVALNRSIISPSER